MPPEYEGHRPKISRKAFRWNVFTWAEAFVLPLCPRVERHRSGSTAEEYCPALPPGTPPKMGEGERGRFGPAGLLLSRRTH